MSVHRRGVLASFGGLAAASLMQVPAFAKAPLAAAQATGLSRIRVGSVEVTAISDGYIDLAYAIFSGADEATLKKLQAANYRPEGAHRTSVNAYVINTGEKLAIVDSGTIKGFAPSLARFLPAFAAAGFDAGAVDIILVTHLHPDHVGGMFSEAGAVFPNATLALHQKEHAFWSDEGIASRAPVEAQQFFRIAGNALKPYAARTLKVQGGQEVLPGVSVVELFGHTPGHVGYRIASGNQQLLLWGDIIHAPAYQFPNPAITLSFDADADAARASRMKILDEVSADRIMVAGAHLDFPGFGHVAKAGNGYAFAPTPFGSGL